MDATQKETIVQLCNQFEQLNIEESITEAYKDKGDITQILVLGKPIPFWIMTLKDLFAQFKSELQSDSSFFLPFNYVHPQRGEGDLSVMLNQIITAISTKQPLDGLENQIRWLVEYQINWGFWQKSTMKVHDVKAIDLKTKTEEITLLKNQLGEDKKKVEVLISDLSNEKQKVVDLLTAEKQNTVDTLTSERQKVVDFFAAKTTELQTIVQDHTQAKVLLTEITNYSKEGNTLKSDINAILETQKQNLADIKKKMEDDIIIFDAHKKAQTELEESLKQKIDVFQKQNETFNETLKYVEGKKVFFEQKEAEIIKLTGLAADGSLGHTFNTRKDELKKPVNFWKWAMPVMTGITILWVVAVFTRFFQEIPVSVEWGIVIVNIIKTVPMFILLGFTVNQYTKERNLQEEYAFKAAVAMTITAYSDKLNNPENKESLIMDSVQKIYITPKIQTEKAGSIFSVNMRKLTDNVKILTDAVKEIKK